jgi:cytochrome c biogenesis protein CcmG, thiol:disulfide interchange protein DsbE
MSNKPTMSKRKPVPRPSTARRKQQRGVSRRVVLSLLGGALAVVAIVAIAISATGGSADAGAQTRPVDVTGAALPAYTGSGDDPAGGAVAPELDGATFDGTPVAITNDGRAKVVMFIAHWCPHCRAEVPRITDWLADSGMPADVDLYAVATGTNADAPNYPPSKWLSDADWPVTTMADDSDSTAAAAFGLQSYPYFVVIDSTGHVVARQSGELTQDQFTALLQAAVSE